MGGAMWNSKGVFHVSFIFVDYIWCVHLCTWLNEEDTDRIKVWLLDSRQILSFIVFEDFLVNYWIILAIRAFQLNDVYVRSASNVLIVRPEDKLLSETLNCTNNIAYYFQCFMYVDFLFLFVNYGYC